MKKYVNGILTGALFGTALGMMILPQLDRKTQKMMRRAGNKLMCFTEDSCMSLRNKMN